MQHTHTLHRHLHRHGLNMAMLLTAIALPVTIWHIAFAPVAEAAGVTCTWTGSDFGNFSDAGNWDCGHVPTSEDDVIISGVTTVDDDYTVNSLHSHSGGGITGMVNTITVLNGATIDNGFCESPLIGNVTFNGTSENFSTITGDVIFNDTAYNNGGTIDGNITFSASNITHDPLGGGSVTGTVTFSSLTPVTFTIADGNWFADTSAWVFDTPGQQWIFNGSVANESSNLTGDVTFNGSTLNDGTITGNVTFNDATENGGTVNGDAVFTTSSVLFDPVGNVTGAVTFSSGTPVTFTINSIWASDTTDWTFTTPGQQWIFTENGLNQATITGNVTFNDNAYNTGGITGDVTLNDNSHTDGAITGNVTFNDNAYNIGGITGDATFNGTAHNTSGGSVMGDVTFNGTAYNDGDGGITGNVTFNEGTYNNSNITGDVTFNGTAHNNSGGSITGNATFNSSSLNDGGTINGNATFNSSSLNDGGTINGDVTFNGAGYNNNRNSGDIIGNVTFNGDAYNQNDGTITGDVTFNDTARNNNGTITGDVTFNDTTHNAGTITGDVTFVGDASYNNMGTINGTITRMYTANTTTTKNFTTDGGYSTWIIVADGAVVDVSGATYGPGNDFQTLNNGSFTANGEIEGVEACDDGNVTAGDGCSATMTVEAGYACTGEPSACTVIPSSGGSSPAPTETQEQSAGGGRGSSDRTHPSPASPDKDPSHETTDTGDVGDVNDADDSSDSQEGAQESGANDRVRPAPVPSSNAVKRLTYGEVAKSLDLVLPPVKPAATDRQGRARAVGAAETAPRGAVIAMILERMAIPLEETRSPFADVVHGSRDERAMATAWKLGLIRGDTDEQGNPKGTSRPHDPITQKEIQYIIDRIERLRRNGELEGL